MAFFPLSNWGGIIRGNHEIPLEAVRLRFHARLFIKKWSTNWEKPTSKAAMGTIKQSEARLATAFRRWLYRRSTHCCLRKQIWRDLLPCINNCCRRQGRKKVTRTSLKPRSSPVSWAIHADDSLETKLLAPLFLFPKRRVFRISAADNIGK